MTIFSGQNLSYINLILAVFALALAIYSLVTLYSLNKLRKTFFAGRTGADLEQVIQTLYKELNNLQEEHMVLENTLGQLQHHFEFAVQKTGIVRFNPFNDDGGNFSFSLALLDGHNTGIVLTSMHGRQQNRIYTKSIRQGKSESALTDEEQQAINMANDKFQIPNFEFQK